MRASRFGRRLALVSAALLFVSPAYAQTAPQPTPPVITPAPPVVRPPQIPPIIRQLPPVVAQPAPAPTQPAPHRGTTTSVQPGTVTVIVRRPDADGDGHNATASGGDDCDDSDASRYPGNPERANTRDEDCNDATYAGAHDGDQDGDGFISDRFSNTRANGVVNAGPDCNDAEATINILAQELPNGIDDDCDGEVDNLLGTWWDPTRPSTRTQN